MGIPGEDKIEIGKQGEEEDSILSLIEQGDRVLVGSDITEKKYYSRVPKRKIPELKISGIIKNSSNINNNNNSTVVGIKQCQCVDRIVDPTR